MDAISLPRLAHDHGSLSYKVNSAVIFLRWCIDYLFVGSSLFAINLFTDYLKRNFVFALRGPLNTGHLRFLSIVTHLFLFAIYVTILFIKVCIRKIFPSLLVLLDTRTVLCCIVICVILFYQQI